MTGLLIPIVILTPFIWPGLLWAALTNKQDVRRG